MRRLDITIKSAVNYLLILLLIYFIYHTISGNRGLLSYFNLRKSLQEEKEYLADLIAQRKQIERKTILLNPNNIDLDFLDELARKELGLINKNEKCFLLKILENTE